MMNFEQMVEDHREEIIQKLQQLIRIRSVGGEAEIGKPFGNGPYEALQYVLGLSRELGLQTKDVQGYAGHAEFGEGTETVGVLVHLDVVPEGTGWSFPPFEGRIHEGKLYGRGAIDDKGPAIAVLYAVKILMDSGVELNKKIRIVFGTDEENGFDGIRYYLSKEKAFEIGFTPDAAFPLICGEKGILVYKVSKSIAGDAETGKIKAIKGGTAPNMVPGSCDAILHLADGELECLKKRIAEYQAIQGYEYNLEIAEGFVMLSSRGRMAHASAPEAGLNGISTMLLLLGDILEDRGEIAQIISLYNERIGMQFNGEALDCSFSDEMSGKLTLNVGKLSINEEGIEMMMDVRYPISYKAEQVTQKLHESFGKAGYELKQLFALDPIYFGEENPLRSTLHQVYKDVTGDEQNAAIITGGATYARAMKNLIAFGPVFPGDEDLVHKEDEYIEIEKLLLLTKLYTQALYELAKA